MKTITNKLFRITLLLVNLTLFGQEINDSIVLKHEFFFKNFDQKILDAKNWANVGPEQKNILIKNIYNSYRTDPVKIKKMFRKNRIELEKQCRNDSNQFLEVSQNKLGGIQTRIINKLKEELEPLAYELLKTHLLIKGTVASIKEINNVVESNSNIDLRLRYMKVRIEEILLGNKNVKVNDEIEIYYNINWVNTNTANWQINQTYLFSLSYRLMEDLKTEISLNTFSDSSSGYFPIKDNILFDSTKHFGVDERVVWSNFKNRTFENKLFKIINGGKNDEN